MQIKGINVEWTQTFEHHCILIRYGQKYIAQWEINTKRKHKRAKDHLHDTQSSVNRARKRSVPSI